MPGHANVPRPGQGQTSLPLREVARRFRRLSASRRALLIEAIFWLAVARIGLIAIPFRHLASWFGTVSKPKKASEISPHTWGEDGVAVAKDVGWAVTRAARYVPFRAVCLPQAIAAKAMLDRRRIACVMHFGVAKNRDAPMDAHAWLDVGAVEVTGFPIAAGIVEVACFL